MTDQLEVTSKLKFIGSIMIGQKINIASMTTTPDSFFSNLYRSLFTSESRASSIKWVQGILRDSFSLLEKHIKDDQIILAKNLMVDLRNALIGFGHLKTTYKDDLYFKCNMDSFTETIKSRINHIIVTNRNVFDELEELEDFPPVEDVEETTVVPNNAVSSDPIPICPPKPVTRRPQRLPR